MKTTLNIDDRVMERLREESARQGRTMSELVEAALRLLFQAPRKTGKPPRLPSLRSGGIVWTSRTAKLSTAQWRNGPECSAWYTTWGILYKFLRVTTHPRVFRVAGNLVHDARTAILMREHGIKQIYTHDTDFHRFPFVEVVDPLA